jgi:hypothetical protein
MKKLYLSGALYLLITACGGKSTNPDPYTKDSTAGQVNSVSGQPDSIGIVDTGAVRPITPVQ